MPRAGTRTGTGTGARHASRAGSASAAMAGDAGNTSNAAAGGADVSLCKDGDTTSDSVPPPPGRRNASRGIGLEGVQVPPSGTGQNRLSQSQPLSQVRDIRGGHKSIATISWHLPSRCGAKAWRRFGFRARKRAAAWDEGDQDGTGKDLSSAVRPLQRARCDRDAVSECMWVSCNASYSTSPNFAPSLCSRLNRDTIVDKLVQRLMRHTSHSEAACYAALHLCGGSTTTALSFLHDPCHLTHDTNHCCGTCTHVNK